MKDRAAWSMIRRAEARGDIRKGITLIESTSGNTGIALAMIAAARGYPIELIMPANATAERYRRSARPWKVLMASSPPFFSAV